MPLPSGVIHPIIHRIHDASPVVLTESALVVVACAFLGNRVRCRNPRRYFLALVLLLFFITIVYLTRLCYCSRQPPGINSNKYIYNCLAFLLCFFTMLFHCASQWTIILSEIKLVIIYI